MMERPASHVLPINEIIFADPFMTLLHELEPLKIEARVAKICSIASR